MNTSLKICLAAVAGAVLGVCTTTPLVCLKTAGQDAKLYSVGIYDKARIAAGLEAGGRDEVVARLAQELGAAAVTISRQTRENEWSQNALWMIRTFFEVSGKPAPEKAQTILDKLPPEAPRICQIERQRILAMRASTHDVGGTQRVTR
jgi:hypothetical protein